MGFILLTNINKYVSESSNRFIIYNYDEANQFTQIEKWLYSFADTDYG